MAHVLRVSQVIDQARTWVAEVGSKTPGFCGAHLMGSLTAMKPDANFATYRDVDINLVVDATRREPKSIYYQGLILEYAGFPLERYRSPEVVLADPALASHLATNSILTDPTGMLTQLQHVVSHRYHETQWIQARCASAKQRALRGLNDVRAATSPSEAVVQSTTLLAGLTGMIAVANCQPPTYRRSLILMKHILEAHNRADLAETVLDLFGYAHLTHKDVLLHLQACAETFDYAVTIVRRPVPFGYKLQPYLKPYLVKGAQEMIATGHYREAMFWISSFLLCAHLAIQQNAPKAQQAYFQTKADTLLADLGWHTDEAIQVRCQRIQALIPEIVRAAQELIGSLDQGQMEAFSY